jgi:hypothetical protein
MHTLRGAIEDRQLDAVAAQLLAARRRLPKSLPDQPRDE